MTARPFGGQSRRELTESITLIAKVGKESIEKEGSLFSLRTVVLV